MQRSTEERRQKEDFLSKEVKGFEKNLLFSKLIIDYSTKATQLKFNR